jgi:hypothetical protein
MKKIHLTSIAAGLVLALSALTGSASDALIISAGSAQIAGGVGLLAQLDSNQVGSSNRVDSAVNSIDCKKVAQESSNTWGAPAGEAKAGCEEIVYQAQNPPMGMTFMQRNRWDANESAIRENYEQLRAGVGDSVLLDNRIRQLERQQDNFALQRLGAMQWKMIRGLDYPARPLRN